MPFLEIERIWTDDDGMVQLDFRLSNDMQMGKQDFYIYPERLSEFGVKLQDFPKSINDVEKIEYGEDPNFYCYFLLSAIVLDSVGHSALEFKFDNRLDPPSKAEVHFYANCEPATINELGRKLVSWSKDMNEPFRYEWKNA